MKRFFIISLFIPFLGLGQELPDLSIDNFLYWGGIPTYRINNDSTCKTVYYHENGFPKMEGKCINGKKLGIWSVYHFNGNIEAKGIIKDTIPWGKWNFYYPDGNPKASGEFVPGKFELGCAGSEIYKDVAIMNGKWNFWYPSGKKQIECHFSPSDTKEQNLHGEYKEWYSTGIQKSEGIYYKGQKNGKWIYYHMNGIKSKEEYYKYKYCTIDDWSSYEFPSGVWKYWNEKGALIKSETYSNGELEEK